MFAARFMKQYSITSNSYKTASSREISVSAQASYSGLISVSGGFTLDQSERKAASEFNKEIETTTITVGAAPPRNGEATYWVLHDSEYHVYYILLCYVIEWDSFYIK